MRLAGFRFRRLVRTLGRRASPGRSSGHSVHILGAMAGLSTQILESGVELIRLQRPKANTFDLELMGAVRDAIAEAVANDQVRALVITGEGKFFSAGLDFVALQHALMSGPDAAVEFGASMRETFLALWQCPKPTIAAVNGHAIAAGLFLALCCDVRFVLEADSKFAVNELLFGAGFPPIAIELGRWAMGRDFAEVILGAAHYDWRAGLANNSFQHHAASADELLSKAVSRAAAAGAMPGAAYAHVKQQLIAPHLERVLAETPEHAAKTSAIYTSPESLATMQKYLAGGMK